MANKLTSSPRLSYPNGSEWIAKEGAPAGGQDCKSAVLQGG